jgi:hypothetical protein
MLEILQAPVPTDSPAVVLTFKRISLAASKMILTLAGSSLSLFLCMWLAFKHDAMIYESQGRRRQLMTKRGACQLGLKSPRSTTTFAKTMATPKATAAQGYFVPNVVTETKTPANGVTPVGFGRVTLVAEVSVATRLYIINRLWGGATNAPFALIAKSQNALRTFR